MASSSPKHRGHLPFSYALLIPLNFQTLPCNHPSIHPSHSTSLIYCITIILEYQRNLSTQFREQIDFLYCYIFLWLFYMCYIIILLALPNICETCFLSSSFQTLDYLYASHTNLLLNLIFRVESLDQYLTAVHNILPAFLSLLNSNLSSPYAANLGILTVFFQNFPCILLF